MLLERTLSSGRPSPQNSARRPTARHVRRPLQQGRAPSPSLTCTPGERCSAVAGCTVVCAWDTCLMMVVGVTCRAIRGVPGAWKTRRQHLKEATSDEFPASQHTSRSTLHPERHARVRVHVGSQSARSHPNHTFLTRAKVRDQNLHTPQRNTLSCYSAPTTQSSKGPAPGKSVPVCTCHFVRSTKKVAKAPRSARPLRPVPALQRSVRQTARVAG